MSRTDAARTATWITFALAGMVWVATWYRDHWYYYDEWKMIGATRDSWLDMFDGFQGHLEVLSYVVYRFQRSWFGLQGHQLVWLAFMASILGLQLSIAAVLRRLGLTTGFALLAATLVTYFGPGGQSVTWEFQLGINFALTLCFVAAFVALRAEKAAGAAGAIAALLVMAVACDSGLGVLGAIFVGILVLAMWPIRHAALALGPPLVAGLAWVGFGDPGVHGSASMSKMFTFASRLLFVAAGGLVGGGETRSVVELTPSEPTIPLGAEWVGAIAIAAASACVVFGFIRRRLSRVVIITFAAGTVAAVFGVAALARERAFLVPPAQFPGSRYVHWIAIFLLVAFAPAIAATVRPAVRRSRLIAAAFAAGLIAVFVLNLGQLGPVRRFSEDWAAGVKVSVQQAITVLDEGCGMGDVAKAAMPSPDLAPQITVALLQGLMAEGALPSRFGIPATEEMRRIVCKPSRSSIDPDARAA